MGNDDEKYKVCLIDGMHYDPFYPSGPTPLPETVAYGLAHLCRYGGHVYRPYTVAEHCIWVAMHLACGGSDNILFEAGAHELATGYFDWARVFDYAGPVKARLALLGLVHDAPEGCGLVDVTGPVLRNVEMLEYKEAHKRCEAWLFDGWGIEKATVEEHKIVKTIDTAILGAELALRAPNATAYYDNGDPVIPWLRLSLARKHDLSRLGSKAIREAWTSAFHRLRRK